MILSVRVSGLPSKYLSTSSLKMVLSVVADDLAHSAVEPRYYVLGQTDAGRRLFIVFTIRRRRIRIISARDMSPKERRAYRDQTQKKTDIQD